jgi:hypothetical protein
MDHAWNHTKDMNNWIFIILFFLVFVNIVMIHVDVVIFMFDGCYYILGWKHTTCEPFIYLFIYFLPFLHFETHKFCTDIFLQFSHEFYWKFVILKVCDRNPKHWMNIVIILSPCCIKHHKRSYFISFIQKKSFVTNNSWTFNIFGPHGAGGIKFNQGASSLWFHTYLS